MPKLSTRMIPNRSGRAFVYGIADRVTLRRGIRRSINDSTIRIPPQWARYYPSVYQPATHAFVQSRCGAGTTAIDVGAHIGVFSVFMARTVGPSGHVVSFEPTSDTRAALHRVVECNKLGSIIDVRKEAVSHRVGTASLHPMPAATSAANSLVAQPGSVDSVCVETVTLDSVVSSTTRVSCLKIDAEGAELDVLEGARGLIELSRPAIALDVHPKALALAELAVDDLRGLLNDLGYQPCSIPNFADHDAPFDVLLDHTASSR